MFGIFAQVRARFTKVVFSFHDAITSGLASKALMARKPTGRNYTFLGQVLQVKIRNHAYGKWPQRLGGSWKHPKGTEQSLIHHHRLKPAPRIGGSGGHLGISWAYTETNSCTTGLVRARGISISGPNGYQQIITMKNDKNDRFQKICSF